MSDDRQAFHSSLHASTVALLGYDAGRLSAAHRVDRAVTLRLTIDDLQARQLRGEQIHVAAFVDASSTLTTIGNPRRGTPSFQATWRLCPVSLRPSTRRSAKRRSALPPRSKPPRARLRKSASSKCTKCWSRSECGAELDECMRDVAEQGELATKLITKLHHLGVDLPTFQQWDVLGGQALKTALMSTIWKRHSEHLAPNQRRSFKALVDGWAATIRGGVGAAAEDEAA